MMAPRLLISSCVDSDVSKPGLGPDQILPKLGYVQTSYTKKMPRYESNFMSKMFPIEARFHEISASSKILPEIREHWCGPMFCKPSRSLALQSRSGWQQLLSLCVYMCMQSSFIILMEKNSSEKPNTTKWIQNNTSNIDQKLCSIDSVHGLLKIGT